MGSPPRGILEPGITEEVLDLFRANGTRHTYQKNQLVIAVGDDFDNLFLIEAGKFSFSSIDRHGRSSVYGYKSPGSLWGLAGVLLGTPASFFFESVAESVAVCVSREALWALIDHDPVIRRAIIRRLGWAVFEATTFGHEERMLPLKKRLANFLIRNADDDGVLELPQSVLARNLGVSRYAVGTQLQMLKRLNLIEIEYGRVRILNRSRLMQFGEPS
ncbi:MAG: Crp/Fnr family transcriptional regulator [Pseudomonadota bacterium]